MASKGIGLKQTKGNFQLKGVIMGTQKDSFYKEMVAKNGKPFRMLNFGVQVSKDAVIFVSLSGGEQEFVYFSGKLRYIVGGLLIVSSIILNIGFFVPKDWLKITDTDKFSGISWQKQMTISIFDYLPIYAKLPPINEAPLIPEIMDGKATIIDYKKGSDFQYGTINVTEEAVVRLPLFDFPGMQVKVNGEVISHYNNDCRGHDFCYGLITFKLSVGEHKVEVELKDTLVRTIGNITSLVSIIIIIWLSF